MLTLLYSRTRNCAPCSRQLESNGLFFEFNFELILPITCFIASLSESFINQFAIIASILPRIFRQSNLSFGARDNMNNVLSRTKRGSHLHPFSGNGLWFSRLCLLHGAHKEGGVPVEKSKLQGLCVSLLIIPFTYFTFLSFHINDICHVPGVKLNTLTKQLRFGGGNKVIQAIKCKICGFSY